MLVRETKNMELHMYKIEIEATGHVTNTYVIKDKSTNKLAVVDPAFDGNRIKEQIKSIGELECVVITHSHADHIAGLKDLVDGTNAKVYIHLLDKEGLYNPVLNEEQVVATKVKAVDEANVQTVEDEEIIKIGNLEFTVMYTPGHTQGSLIVYNEQEQVLISGDTIFKSSYGRTDLITSNTGDMGISLDKIFNKFENIYVYPGHGEEFELANSKRRIKLLFAFNAN